MTPPADLLTVEHIAKMWHCSERHARDVIVRKPGFPAPAPGSGPKHRVWLKSEVRAFVQRKPARIPQEHAAAKGV